ncbi:transporter substrate-binding domain-containing protein [Pelomonas sp. SE-A7]|uniref:substrate-binding periplasmic protein n=1 Tax=Pelomonas sp. SE-A7 TaxID=3054953 RepID=UPI00259CE2BE|nr:transporter substrate-binding domain-containing protein [Pelomonas sp. SE-A7]MDM4768430.1 transporter substrate-binding domain-containing protein [Pelomonas sp. SE-A7]
MMLSLPRLFRALPALALTAALHAPAWAQPPGCTAPLRVGISPLGVAYSRQGGEVKGYDFDLIRELSRRLGCTYDLIEMNRVRIFQSLERGELIDLATSASRTPERDQHALFVPMAQTRDYLLVHKRLAKPDFDLNSFVAMPELKLGVLAGSNYSSFIVARIAVLNRQGRIETTTQADSLIPRLVAGRYDGLVTTPAYFVAALRELPGAADIRALPIPESEPYLSGLYLSRKTLDEPRRQQIREALQSIHQDGTLLRILRNYFPEAMARERAGFKPGG